MKSEIIASPFSLSKMNIWVNLESNCYPFKVKLIGEDVYNLKKEIKNELKPKQDTVIAFGLIVCPPFLLDKTFRDDLLVLELRSLLLIGPSQAQGCSIIIGNFSSIQ